MTKQTLVNWKCCFLMQRVSKIWSWGVGSLAVTQLRHRLQSVEHLDIKLQQPQEQRKSFLTHTLFFFICLFPSAYLSNPVLLCWPFIVSLFKCICHPDILSISVWPCVVTVSCLIASVLLLNPTCAQKVHMLLTTHKQRVIPTLSIVHEVTLIWFHDKLS